MTTADRASVVVCAFASGRLEQTIDCVESVRAQRPAPAQVLVVVDHNEDLRVKLRERVSHEVEVAGNEGEPGLSAARNTAVRLSRGEAIVFIDDDAVAHGGWLSELLTAFDDSAVIGAGGHARPAWEGERPRWLPDELLWVVGCSYEGLAASGPVRNPLGCNMAFRAELFDRAGVFDPRVGRLGSRPIGCEETEFCVRAARVCPGSRVVMVAGAEVDHHVPVARARPGYVLRRCYHEGASKAAVRRLADTRALDTERAYLRRILPARVRRSFGHLVTGPDRGDAAAQIGVIVGGMLAAAAGYAAATTGLTVRNLSNRLCVPALEQVGRRSKRPERATGSRRALDPRAT